MRLEKKRATLEQRRALDGSVILAATQSDPGPIWIKPGVELMPVADHEAALAQRLQDRDAEWREALSKEEVAEEASKALAPDAFAWGRRYPGIRDDASACIDTAIEAALASLSQLDDTPSDQELEAAVEEASRLDADATTPPAQEQGEAQS